jgi:hypothetical protein
MLSNVSIGRVSSVRVHRSSSKAHAHHDHTEDPCIIMAHGTMVALVDMAEEI